MRPVFVRKLPAEPPATTPARYASQNSPPSQAACDFASRRAQDMCDSDTLSALNSQTGELMGGVEMCGHPCIQEMLDCIDSPALARDREHLQMLQATCGGAQAECLPIIANLGRYFDEACCTGAGLPACPQGPPSTCTTGCAAMYLPFWQDCSSVLQGYVQIEDAVDGMRVFNELCERAHPDLEPSTPVVPPPAPPPPPPPQPQPPPPPTRPAGGGH